MCDRKRELLSTALTLPPTDEVLEERGLIASFKRFFSILSESIIIIIDYSSDQCPKLLTFRIQTGTFKF